jgi:hypothetical protein
MPKMVALPIHSARQPFEFSCLNAWEQEEAGLLSTPTAAATPTRATPAMVAPAAAALPAATATAPVTAAATAAEATTTAAATHAAATAAHATTAATAVAAAAMKVRQLRLLDHARISLWRRSGVRETGQADGRKAECADDCARADNLLQDHAIPL